MNKRFSMFLNLITLVTLAFCIGLDARTPCKHRRVIEVNETILAKQPDTYQEIRHIVLRGTNYEIGKAIGDIAQEWLHIKKPLIFKRKLFGEANREYRLRNNPLLEERLLGVAQSYHLAPNTLLLNELLYDLFPVACAVTSFPALSSKDGHAFVVHNFDWQPGSWTDLYGGPKAADQHGICSRNFVMELYPTDGGYASLCTGGMDLLNGIFGGINSEGLFVSVLVDQQSPKNPHVEDLETSCGFTPQVLIRLILDTCATVEEAKTELLLNKLIFSFVGVHFLIVDATGTSVICEIDPKFFQWHFTDNGTDPQVMTNHAVYQYSDTAKFPVSTDPYSSFNRYKKLNALIKQHAGSFSREDAYKAMESVFGRGSPDKSRIQFRTFWNETFDLNDKTLKVQFYLKDGPLDEQTNSYGLIFSEPFSFKLKV